MKMQPDKMEQHEFDAKGYNLCSASSQAWPYDNFVSPNVSSRSTVLDMVSVDQLNTFWGNAHQLSQANGGRTPRLPDSVSRPEQRSIISPTVPPTIAENLTQDTQRGHIGHSNTCASYSYLEPHFKDSMLANGHPQLIYPDLHGVPHCTTASSYVIPEEPVYVNAKQYHGILRRRQLRAKAELENKVTRSRKQPYLHESRHLHALRRARGCGGRFINTKKQENVGSSNATHNCEEDNSRYDAHGRVESSMTSGDREFKRHSVQENQGLDFFQWARHKNMLS